VAIEVPGVRRARGRVTMTRMMMMMMRRRRRRI
jgi:hypothetical protein